MTLTEYPNLTQNTDEWYAARCGLVTASAVGRLLSVTKPTAIYYACPDCNAPAMMPCANKRGNGAMKTMHSLRGDIAAAQAAHAANVITAATGDDAKSLTLNLVAERITGYTEPTWINDDMARGIRDEPIARDLYAEHYGTPVREVGFMVRESFGYKIGYSPDGSVGVDGLLEVKSRRQKKHLATILADAVPAENMAQLQCGLFVSGRSWCDYVSYCGGMPMWRKRVYPDRQWFAAISAAVELFETTAEQMIADYTKGVEGLPETERDTFDDEMVI